MMNVRIHGARAAGLAAVLALSLIAGAARLGAAQTGSGITAVEFDEIDHVYTTDPVPGPGSFAQDATQVVQAPAAAPPARRNSGVLGALGAAGTVLGAASSVVASSGELGRALRISDAAARVVPVADAMGLAGGRRFDALLQTYVLPRVSPSGASMLTGFLGAQADYKLHFPAAPAGTTPPQLQPYAKGALRHYVVASNGWVRIDDPATKTIVIIKPDAGKSYAVDTVAQTVRTADYVRAGATTAAAAPAGPGAAAFSDQVETLGQTTIEGVSAVGYRTRSTVRIAGSGSGCPDTTITSSRVEYFATFHSPAAAANAMGGPANADPGGVCAPKTTVKHAGSTVPGDLLALYQANTIDKRTAAGTDHYTVVIERGNIRAKADADTTTFDLPANVRQVSAAQP